MTPTTAAYTRVLPATTLIGDPVHNNLGESLGEIKDLVIDLEKGNVAYAVLSFGGFLGLGNKLFAIPWSSLKVNPKERCFIINATKERLEKAPGFDKDNWPDMADRTWGAEVHRYYGANPYWV